MKKDIYGRTRIGWLREIEIITKYQNGKEPEYYIMNGQDELVRIDLTNKKSPRKGDPSPVYIMTHKGKTPFLKSLSTKPQSGSKGESK